MNISDSFWGVGLNALVAKLALVINKIGNDDVENLDGQGLYDYELNRSMFTLYWNELCNMFTIVLDMSSRREVCRYTLYDLKQVITPAQITATGYRQFVRRAFCAILICRRKTLRHFTAFCRFKALCPFTAFVLVWLEKYTRYFWSDCGQCYVISWEWHPGAFSNSFLFYCRYFEALHGGGCYGLSACGWVLPRSPIPPFFSTHFNSHFNTSVPENIFLNFLNIPLFTQQIYYPMPLKVWNLLLKYDHVLVTW